MVRYQCEGVTYIFASELVEGLRPAFLGYQAADYRDGPGRLLHAGELPGSWTPAACLKAAKERER